MRLSFTIALTFAVFGLTGCETTEKPADSTLPQSQPASWQGGIPGMSGMQSGPGYR